MAFLELKNINMSYGNQDVLKDVNLSFNLGEFVVIIGPSGCGKSTLLQILGLQETPTSGHVYIEGNIPSKRRRRHYMSSLFGFIYQNFQLVPYYSVRENLMLPFFDRKIDASRINETLEALDIADKLSYLPNEMSGGEQQRVAVARTLLRDSRVIIADEPTGSLDSKNAKKIMDILKSNNDGRLIVMATHNRELANQYATRIIEINDAHIISDQTIKAIETIDCISLDGRTKHLSLLSSFKYTLQSYKRRKKVVISTALLFSICLLGIMLTFGLHDGLDRYISYLWNARLDSRYVYIEEYANKKSTKLNTTFLDDMASGGIEYVSINNLNYLANNFFLDALYQDDTFDFYYEISFVDFSLLSSYQLNLLGSDTIPDRSGVIMNALFYDEVASVKPIHLEWNDLLLATTLTISNEFKIEGIIDEGSLYNNPRLYFDYQFWMNEILPPPFINYFYNEQDILNIPSAFLITSNFDEAYEYINDHPKVYDMYSPFEVKEDDYYIFTTSSGIIRSSFASLIEAFKMIMICSLSIIFICTLSLLSLIMTYIFKDRTQEIALLKSFGADSNDLLTLGFSEGAIITGSAFIISLLITIICSRLSYRLSSSIMGQSWRCNLITISSSGLLTSFFISIISSFISISIPLRKCEQSSLGRVLKNE